MSTRHDRREQQLRERRKKQRHVSTAPRRGLSTWMTAAIVAGVVVLALLGARQAGMFEPPPAKVDLGTPPPASEVVGLKQPDQGNSHVPLGQAVQYPSLPPTSGNHWDLPHAGWGVKTATARDENVLHNLEHGGIAIAYNGLTDDEVVQLRALVRQLNESGFPKVLAHPYPNLKDAKVAVTAWNWILRTQTYDPTQITRFVQAHYGTRGDAPEPNAT